MQKQLLLGKKTLLYTIRESRRAKHVRLAVHVDGTIIVTAPGGFQDRFIAQFLVEKGDWILSKISSFKRFIGVNWMYSSKREYEASREATRLFVLKRLAYFNEHYRLSYNRVSIRNQKTRWGSCSLQGNLNFHYLVAFLPAHLADYIVVHELCHLAVFNHSDQFWKRVAETIPNVEVCRSELRSFRRALR